MNHRIPIILSIIICFSVQSFAGISEREMLFDDNWKFSLQDKKGAENPEYADANWRVLDLPHDWSIEGKIDSTNSTASAGGYFPTGVGWYRKTKRRKK